MLAACKENEIRIEVGNRAAASGVATDISNEDSLDIGDRKTD